MRRGSSGIEFILTTFLLILFVITTFSLVAAANTAYDKVQKKRDTISNMRIATAYIDNRVKQANGGTVRLDKTDADTDAIVISEASKNSKYETWIYSYDGFLNEAIFYVDEEKDSTIGTKIVDTVSMEVLNIKNDVYEVVLKDSSGNVSKILIETDMSAYEN